MTKLTDLQSILLSTAAQRESGSLFPAPETIADAGDLLTKAIASLVKRRFAEERETSDRAATHRTDGDLAYGVFITETGLVAIGVSDAVKMDDAANAGDPAIAEPPPEVENAPRVTKSSAVLALLRREDGATLAELIAATGWLPHTTRAALTGIRKKGNNVERIKRGDETCYQITAVAEVAA